MASWNRRPSRGLLDTSFFFPVRGLGGLGLLISCRLGGRRADRGLRPPDLVSGGLGGRRPWPPDEITVHNNYQRRTINAQQSSASSF